jgi:hypothetical protein
VLRITVAHDEYRVDVGGVATFGRTVCPALPCEDGTPDIQLGGDERLHRHLGRVRALDDGWVLTNTGRWLHLDIRDADGSGLDRFQPGDERRVPWRASEVVIHLGDETYGFRAVHDGVEAVLAPPVRADRPPEVEDTSRPFTIDRDSGYFRALVGLCAPRLLTPSTRGTPTNAEIARFLNAHAAEARELSAKTVERRLDYCTQLFGLKQRADSGSCLGSENRDARTQLADLALATGTITIDDLQALAT